MPGVPVGRPPVHAWPARSSVAALGLAVAALALGLAAPARAAGRCAPRAVPGWQAVTGVAPGQAPATGEQVGAYLRAIDAASPRVTSAVLGSSTQGRPLPYAVVARPGTLARLGAIAARLRAVRDGRIVGTPRRTPPIVWLTAGVHANEPSGIDADMAVLHDLAAGRLCAPLRRLVVVIAPLQNPDGLAAATRTNAAGFDLNRDWFAATQPETRAMLALLDRLPPTVLADQHEQEGGRFFFPPNADPIHHEVPGPARRTIAGVLAPALRRAFDRADRAYASYGSYDLFFMGYADAATTTLFGAAGMTFEQGGGGPYAERVAGHTLAAETLLRASARHAAVLLRRWSAIWPRALAQGLRGARQPNARLARGGPPRRQVPRRPVYAYLLRADVHGADAAALVGRLRAAGVRVGRLTRATRLPAFHAYAADAAHGRTLPAGTWVVPLAQTRKHWVEAMLGQDAYAPVARFYDVSSWSNPLLMGLSGGWSERPVPAGTVTFAPAPVPIPPPGAPAYAFAGDSAAALGLAAELLGAGASVVRTPRSGEITVSGPMPADLAARAAARGVVLTAVAGPPAAGVALRAPKIALLADLQPVVGGRPGVENSAVHAPHAWMRFVMTQRLGLPVDVLGPAEIAAGRLDDGGYTALVVADTPVPDGALTPAASAGIRAFVAAGGTYAGVRRPGLAVARAVALTGAAERPVPALDVPGATFAVEIDDRDPVAWGTRGRRGFTFDADDPVLDAGGAPAVVRFAAGGGLVSGDARGGAALGGTPAVLDQTVGAGRVVLFSGDPSFRAYVDGAARLLGNALLAPPDRTRAG